MIQNCAGVKNVLKLDAGKYLLIFEIRFECQKVDIDIVLPYLKQIRDHLRLNERLTGHPWKCFEQPLRLTDEAALWAIRQYQIVCTSTLATRDPVLMEKARAAGRLWAIDTGHDLMITEPEAVADALLQIASA